MAQWLSHGVDLFLHLDVHLAALAQGMGPWLYLLLFVIVFAETGLVVTPILPGDSLLFAAGALAAVEGSGLNVHLIAILLVSAGVIGDAVNYMVGKWLAPRIFFSEHSRIFNRKYLAQTEDFYRRHGPFTIVLARFVPIIRTFAPFVAGIGRMSYARFLTYNLTGAVLWVSAFVYGGYGFGNLPAVKRNFHFVILGIIVFSLLPVVREALRQRRTDSGFR